VDADSWIAIAAAVISLGAAAAIAWNARLARRQQLHLTNKELAGEILDARSGELSEVSNLLDDLSSLLSGGPEGAVWRAQDEILPAVEQAAKQMRGERDRLRIRFKDGATACFDGALTAVDGLLSSESLGRLRALQRSGMDFGGRDAQEKRDRIEAFRDDDMQPLKELIDRTRAAVDRAGGEFQNAAYPKSRIDDS
jgi:hypothetical protein